MDIFRMSASCTEITKKHDFIESTKNQWESQEKILQTALYNNAYIRYHPGIGIAFMDTPTLVLVNILISFGFALLISALWISQSRNEGIGYWVALEWVALASFLLVFLYNRTGGALWMAAAMMGFGLIYALNLEALSFFRRSRSHARLGIVIAALYSLAVVYIQTHDLAWDYRVIVGSGAWAILSLLTIWTLLEHGERTHKRIYHVLAVIFSLNIVFNALRIAATPLVAWFGPLNVAEMQAFVLFETILFKMSADLGIAALILNRMQVRLNYLAHHDDLTEINNRRFFLEMAGRELADCRRKGVSAVLLLMDIDHFKAINDGHGHQAGDCVLFDFARLVRGRLRQHDIFGRLGGEEFAILLPDTEMDKGLDVAERLRLAVQENVIEREGAWLRVTMSIGVACFPHHVLTLDGLMNSADKALYKAKVMGRNRVVTYSG